jgi:hypothetical protein
MASKRRKRTKRLAKPAEIEQQTAMELPNREAMSAMVDPINAATAVNWLSDGAQQVATQVQDVTIVQQGR